MGADSRDWVNRGKTEFAEGRIASACEALRRAVKDSPNDVEARFLLANCLVHSQEFAEAIRLFDQLLQQHDTTAAIHFSKGNALFLSRDYGSAIACYRRGLEFEQNAAARRNLGQALLEQRDFSAAETAFLEALQQDPTDHLALKACVQLYSRRGAIDEATQLVRRIIERSPRNPRLHFMLGNLWSDQQSHNEALTAYRKAAKFEPESARVRYNIGHTLSLLGQWDEAVEAYQQALQISPDNLKVLVELGIAQVRVDDFDDAVATFRRAALAHPKAWEPAICLGDLFAKNNQLDDAARVYERLVSIRETPESLIRLGLTYARLERHSEAITRLQLATELDPVSAVSWQLLGIAQWSHADLNAAEKCFQQVLQINPASRDGYKYLVHLYLQQQNLDDARSLLSVWMTRIPDDPIGQHLSQALRSGSVARASDDYIRAEFDSFADSFDEVLESLEYRAPELVGAAVARLLPSHRRDNLILDAGCGTGLCAKHLRPPSARLVGVDLSEKMVDLARRLDVYDELVVEELTHYLKACGEQFDVIVFADTLCYFGKLDEVLTATSSALQQGGFVVFTVEALTEPPVDDPSVDEPPVDEPFRLSPNGRFRHTKSYVAQVLGKTHFRCLSLQAANLRYEGGIAVAGYVVSATTSEPDEHEVAQSDDDGDV